MTNLVSAAAAHLVTLSRRLGLESRMEPPTAGQPDYPAVLSQKAFKKIDICKVKFRFYCPVLYA